MVNKVQKKDTAVTQPVDIEINAVGELVIVMKNVPTKFEQDFDHNTKTYTLRATWAP